MKNLFLLLTLFTIISCSPSISYLGEQSTPTSEIEVFYDMNDVRRDFKVLGLMTSDNKGNIFVNTENVKNKMIQEAKKKGADAIVFTSFYESDDPQEILSVEAKLLKFQR